MKANNPHLWRITLFGRNHSKSVWFTGRLDEALAEADVLESGVRWVVFNYMIIRCRKPKPTKPKKTS